MTNSTKKSDTCSCVMKRKDVVLDDGFSYYYYQCEKCARVEYDPCQLQKLTDYAKSNRFLFVSDWIVLWMYIGDGAPISGITMMQKQLFILLHEFAQEHNIPTENPGFRAYKFGPYTETIDRNIEALSMIGAIKSVGRLNTSNERFYLTDFGADLGKKIANRFSESELSELKEIRRDLQQFSSDGIMTYVYSKYPKYTEKSVVFERILHRKRG